MSGAIFNITFILRKGEFVGVIIGKAFKGKGSPYNRPRMPRVVVEL
jgi:hypothetical protein